MKNNTETTRKKSKYYIVLTFFEGALILLFAMIFLQPQYVSGGVGEDNTTQTSLLQIGNSEPVIKWITINDSIILVPNAIQTVLCTAIVEEYQGQDDLKNASGEFFDTSISNFGDGDNKTNHYTNSTCNVDLNYGDIYEAQVNCTFEVEYYANPSGWNCSVQVYDYSGFEDLKSNSTTVEPLLALGVPDSIDYGLVNATGVSDEATANVTNYGNVEINLTLESYAQTPGDGYSMNCSVGANEFFIQDDYEKYNLTSSNAGPLNLAQFEVNYTNVTSVPVINEFNLLSRSDESTSNGIKETYWRIYVPEGVAGNCTGNLIFGATQAPGV